MNHYDQMFANLEREVTERVRRGEGPPGIDFNTVLCGLCRCVIDRDADTHDDGFEQFHIECWEKMDPPEHDEWRADDLRRRAREIGR